MKTLALIFQEKKYRNRMMDALQRELPGEWTVAGFETPESLMTWAENNALQVIIMEEDYPAIQSITHLQSFAEERDIPVLWLTKSREELANSQIFMYQAIDQVAQEVLGASARKDRKTRVMETAEPAYCTFYGCWPVEGGCGTTKEACALARRLSGKKTLLLCLDPTPGLPEDCPEQEGGVSELIYLLREYGEDWIDKEELCVRVNSSLHCISGVTCLSDLGLFGEREIAEFICGVEILGYRNVVVDFGSICTGTAQLLSRCDVIYPIGAREGKKWRSFERQAFAEGIAERIGWIEEREKAG